MVALVQGLLNHKYMLMERSTKLEREASLKTMSKYCWDYKKRHQICNKVMVFHENLRPACNNPMPYSMND